MTAVNELRAVTPGADTLATIDWKLPDGRIALLLRVAYHVTAPLPTPGDWAVLITNPAPARPFGAPPFEWRWIDGSPIEDINAVGLKGWQTVTHAPRDVVERAEEFLGEMKAARTWELRE